MSITTDRPRTSSYRAHELTTTRHNGSRITGSRPARPTLQEPSTSQPAQPGVVKVMAGVVATVAILLGLVGIANLRATEPALPALPTTSSISYDVGVAAAPINGNK